MNWFYRLYCWLFRPVTNGAVITDCYDDSAKGRMLTRWRALFGRWEPTFIGLQIHTSELERGSVQAAMHLLDQIDASRAPEKRRWWQLRGTGVMVIMINSASRGDTPSHLHRPNGSPFCWWWVDHYTLVVSTLDGPVLPLANSLGVIPGGVVNELDIVEVLEQAARLAWITGAEADRIIGSQYRSLEFEPLVASWIAQGRVIPSTQHVVSTDPAADVTNAGAQEFIRDNFGNITLNRTPEQIGYREGASIQLANGQTAVCVPSLKDVPKSDTGVPILAITIGSNGLRNPQTGDELRFLELVIMQGSAADYTGFNPGDTVILAEDLPCNLGRHACVAADADSPSDSLLRVRRRG